MATKLGIYNGVLRLCRERKLKNLDENRKPRRLIDTVWADNDPIKFCLELSQWQFATKTVKLEPSADVEPEFGFKYAFEKEEDYVRPVSVSFDEYFQSRLTGQQYADEQDYLFSDVNILYLKYVSNSDLYGRNMGLWPPSFQHLVESFIAYEIVGDLTNSSTIRKEVEDAYEKRMSSAQNKDGVNRPTRQVGGRGGWNGARNGGGHVNRDTTKVR